MASGNFSEGEWEKQFRESNDQITGTTPSFDSGSDKPQLQKENDGVDEEGITTPQDAGEYVTGVKLFIIVVALILSVFLFSLDQTIVATAIPKITDQFRSLDDISWYGSAFFMTLGGFQSMWGKAYKYFPLKLTFLIAIFIFELGSLICGVAPNSLTFIIGRAIAGVGAAGIGSGAYTIVAFAAEPKKRATYTGTLGAAYGVAAVAGPLVGGVLTDKASWRWCFYINLPIGGLAAATIFIFFQTPQAAKPVDATLREKLLQMDPLGMAVMMGAVISFILALQYGGARESWSSSTVVGLLVGFVLILIAFGILEVWQGERSMLTPRLMRDRNVWVNGLYGFFFCGAYFVPLYYLPIYFQSIDNVSPLASGVRNLPLIIAFSVGAVVSGGAISKTGVAAPILTVSAVISTVAAGLLYTLDIGTGSGKWIGYQILLGLGFGVGFQVPIIIVQANAKPTDLASTTAIILFFETVGGAFLVAAAQSGFVNQLLQNLARTAPSVNPALVVATGATDLHKVFSGDELSGILVAYMAGIKVAFAVTIGAVGISIPISLLSKWGKINTADSSEAIKDEGADIKADA
ncbi:hypothetical protein GRF29_103g1161474 [Pseudopithomyces chartarum]|uniref:Major facilitator superfamily (MFS) profile domain-containing protein n=1 Tax=Pseudopithomyces chartarum TaxID=1892770 RepID=A0AAN6LVE1_9PLEO|nr:hypothetical protein GRF29_103g1161474 [Pseudopithomyces chartarum]